ncbi:pirin-like protein isoform X2 [Macadamia integrifolia]|uniref:pirin-like protein isoform X2 n=1 Tax=Macadamia integrifolia TaxID=60698 RepID=UPI001C4EB80A|nr:pirin-like protein isoform X2 [Macadamia integrifolia]
MLQSRYKQITSLNRTGEIERATHVQRQIINTCPYMRAISYRFFFNTFSPIKPNIVVPSFIKNMSAAAVGDGISRPRSVVKVVLAKPQHDGDGALVRRSIGRMELRSLDPFIMLDEFFVSAPAGFPDHPHRGFETVTYMLEGAFTHQDFSGHKGTIRAGDLQWMTAGRGIIHSEMPAETGTQRGLQLWINLSSKDKMIEPKYQEMRKEEIKTAEEDGVEVRVIAGEAMGIQSPVYTRTPAMYLDFTLKPGAKWNQSIPESWNSIVYVIEGEGVFGTSNSSPTQAHHVLVLGPGDGLSAWNKSSDPLRFALIGGQPLNEPIVQYGPFVMNTQTEIDQAIDDYRFCKNGFEKAKYWESQ